jgi:hypothetical protein
MTRARTVAVIAVALTVRASAAPAQATAEPGRLEIGFGPQWIGRAAIGSHDANETTGTGSPFTLFSTSADIAAVTGIEARVGVRLLRRLEVEGVGSYAAPSFVIRTSADVESAPGVTAKERIQQFTVHGAALWYVPGRLTGARTAPFVTAGVGYLRHVHENDVLLASGKIIEAGGGIKQLLLARERRRVKGVGVRADVRAIARAKGVAPDGGTHVSPAVTASLFVRF